MPKHPQTAKRKFAAVYPDDSGLVDVSPGINARENPVYEPRPYMRTEFFESEAELKGWLLQHGAKPGLFTYKMTLLAVRWLTS